MAILQLGLTTSHTDTLCKCACIVLNYCWYNRADTGMQLKRAQPRTSSLSGMESPSTSKVRQSHAMLHAQSRGLLGPPMTLVSSSSHSFGVGTTCQRIGKGPSPSVGRFQATSRSSNPNRRSSSALGSTTSWRWFTSLLRLVRRGLLTASVLVGGARA
jgi:hypothetical protein